MLFDLPFLQPSLSPMSAVYLTLPNLKWNETQPCACKAIASVGAFSILPFLALMGIKTSLRAYWSAQCLLRATAKPLVMAKGHWASWQTAIRFLSWEPFLTHTPGQLYSFFLSCAGDEIKTTLKVRQGQLPTGHRILPLCKTTSFRKEIFLRPPQNENDLEAVGTASQLSLPKARCNLEIQNAKKTPGYAQKQYWKCCNGITGLHNTPLLRIMFSILSSLPQGAD